MAKKLNLDRAKSKAEGMFTTIYRDLTRKFTSKKIFTLFYRAHKNYDDWRELGYDSKEEFIHDCKRLANNDHKEVMEKVNDLISEYKKATTFRIINMMIKNHYEIEFLKDRLKDKEDEVNRLNNHLFNYSNRELKAV